MQLLLNSLWEYSLLFNNCLIFSNLNSQVDTNIFQTNMKRKKKNPKICFTRL